MSADEWLRQAMDDAEAAGHIELLDLLEDPDLTDDERRERITELLPKPMPNGVDHALWHHFVGALHSIPILTDVERRKHLNTLERIFAISPPPDNKQEPIDSPDVWDAIDVLDEHIPPREWMLGTVFCKGFTSSLVGAGAIGKTAVRIVQAIAVSSDRRLTGEHVHKRAKVLFVCFEDGELELKRRIKAALLHHNVTADAKGWLLCCSITKGKLFTVDQHSGLPVITYGFQWLEQYIIENHIELVILDPFIKIHATNENDNSGIEQICAHLAQLAVERNIAVDISHHVRKGAGEPGDADMGRGASAAKDAGRLGYTLTPMTKEMAKECGVADEKLRRSLVRMDSAKVNIGPPTVDTVWFRLVGVPLGNATQQYPYGDNVHTVERWYAPENTVSIHVANQIIDAIDKGLGDDRRYSSAPQAKDRAAWPVVQEFLPAWTEQQCKKLIKDWLEKDVLRSGDYLDPTTKSTRQALFRGNVRPG